MSKGVNEWMLEMLHNASKLCREWDCVAPDSDPYFEDVCKNELFNKSKKRF